MSATILVVDDDQNMRELLRLHLSSAGYTEDAAQQCPTARPPTPTLPHKGGGSPRGLT